MSGWSNGIVLNVTGTDRITRVTSIAGLESTTRTFSILASTGDVAPGTGGLTIKSFTDPVVDYSGDATIRAKLNTTSSTNNEVLLLLSPTNAPVLIARKGDTVAGMGGPTISTFKTVAMRRQDVSFLVTTLNPTNATAKADAFLKRSHSDGMVRTLIHVGQSRTFRNAPVLVESITVPPVANSSGDGQGGGVLLDSSALLDSGFSSPVCIVKLIDPNVYPDGMPRIIGVSTRYRVISLEK